MNNLTLILIIFLSASCFCKINKEQLTQSPIQYSDRNSLKPKEAYTIIKIDSVDNFFLIYAEKDNWVYKVISEKSVVSNCTEIISLKKSYELDLENAKWIYLKDGKDSVKFYPLIASCIIYHDTTQICVEKGESMIAALFSAKNLKGLCLSKEVVSGGNVSN